jgi:hypothetical protein
MDMKGQLKRVEVRQNRRCMKKTLPGLLKFIFSIALVFVAYTMPGQQLNIVSAQFNSLNVSPKALCQVSLINPAGSLQIYLQAVLSDASGSPILTVQTNTFSIHNGLNTTANQNVSIASAVYSNTSVARIIKNTNMLPEGNFNYCVYIKGVAGNSKDING